MSLNVAVVAFVNQCLNSKSHLELFFIEDALKGLCYYMWTLIKIHATILVFFFVCFCYAKANNYVSLISKDEYETPPNQHALEGSGCTCICF